MTEIRNLACKSDNPPQEAETYVDIKNDGEWVRIPVTSSELWINKDGPADITRHAKVKFPTEWDGVDITQYINGLQPSEDGNKESDAPYDEARVWFYDHDTATYQIAHYGYVGGVGPTGETGVNKMYVYDPADLMRGIQVSKSFGEPTIAQVASFAVYGEDDNGNPVGLTKRSVFDNIQYYIAGLQEVAAQKQDMYDLGGAENDGDDFMLGGDLPVVGSFQINVNDFVDDIFDYYFGSEVTNGVLGGQKRFQFNRHNLVDVMDWFMSEIGGRWFFEPSPDGPILFIDNTNARKEENAIFNNDEFENEIFESDEDASYARRMFVDNDVPFEDDSRSTDISNYRDRTAFTSVDVLDNDALYDIKPFNTLTLLGESSTNREKFGGPGSKNYRSSASPGYYTETFPWVKVTYPPLVESAGGYEYGGPSVESDKVYLDQAEHQAKKEFEKHLEEASEGSIELKGEPYIMPHDYIRTVPHCNGTLQNSTINPITYEVNSVKHSRSAGEQYTTELGVSLVFDETVLKVESEYRSA